jgi:hypothetical protein
VVVIIIAAEITIAVVEALLVETAVVAETTGFNFVITITFKKVSNYFVTSIHLVLWDR